MQSILTHFISSPGAAAAAVMSSSKVTTVLRPASQLPNAATAQPAVQHIIHQPIQAGSSQAALQSSARQLQILPGTHLSYISCYYVFTDLRLLLSLFQFFLGASSDFVVLLLWFYFLCRLGARNCWVFFLTDSKVHRNWGEDLVQIYSSVKV